MFNMSSTDAQSSRTANLKRPPYFSFQKVEEDFRRDLILELSDHVIVIVNDLTASDQGILLIWFLQRFFISHFIEFLWSIAQKRLTDSSGDGVSPGRGGQVIVVHNLRTVKSKSDLAKIQKV
jgi:hypothetical protein